MIPFTAFQDRAVSTIRMSDIQSFKGNRLVKIRLNLVPVLTIEQPLIANLERLAVNPRQNRNRLPPQIE